MAKRRRTATGDPTLGEIWLVLTAAPRWEVEDRKGVSHAYVDFHLKRHAFMRRATPVTWADTVAAARRLHREIKAAEATIRRGIFKGSPKG
jgi:hypothetical protein